MPASTSLIRVPAETADAIRRIAVAEGMTIVAFLNGVIGEKRKAGVIDRCVPNVSITAIGPSIAFMIGEGEGRPMPFEVLDAPAARLLANTIDGVATTGIGKVVGDGQFAMTIVRRGRAVVFMQGERRRTMATSVVPELTGWLREVADEAAKAMQAA